MAGPRTYTLDEIQNTLLPTWQRRLRMLDWYFVVEILPSSKMGDNEGYSNSYEKKKHAYVALCDPEDMRDDRIEQYDMEIVLVHEMLHAQLKCFEARIGSHRDIVQEQTIHTHSLSLVTAWRAWEEAQTGKGTE